MLLRLAYHDAATYSVRDGMGGANASIQFELDRPENTGLKRGWNVIQQVGVVGVAASILQAVRSCAVGPHCTPVGVGRHVVVQQGNVLALSKRCMWHARSHSRSATKTLPVCDSTRGGSPLSSISRSSL